jgi:hypothetical protein
MAIETKRSPASFAPTLSFVSLTESALRDNTPQATEVYLLKMKAILKQADAER